MENGEPLACFGMLTLEGATGLYGMTMFAGSAVFGVPCILISFLFRSSDMILFWTADGLSIDEPSSGIPPA